MPYNDTLAYYGKKSNTFFEKIKYLIENLCFFQKNLTFYNKKCKLSLSDSIAFFCENINLQEGFMLELKKLLMQFGELKTEIAKIYV